MIEVTYYYSACVGIHTPDVRILCDPWFTDGILDGSWYQYPKMPNPIETIGPYDLVYISHVHDDHYDPKFLTQYLNVYPKTTVLCPNFKSNFLTKKMTFHGIRHQIIDEMRFGETNLKIFPNESSIYDIDSALAVKRSGHSVVNLNDNLFNEMQLTAIKMYLGGEPQIALLPYTGAGPYPQTYIQDKEILIVKAHEKKQAFFERYLQMRNFLNPRKSIPFAGTYVLCGINSKLNKFRGVADATEIRSIDPNAVVLKDFGQSKINTDTLIPTSERMEPYSQEQIDLYCQKFMDIPMTYETYFAGLDLDSVPFKRLLPIAHKQALSRTHYRDDFYFCIRLYTGEWFVCNVNTDKTEFYFASDITKLQPRSGVELDAKYLFGLLTGVFHWNNAQSGSHLSTIRIPDIFNREVETFLYFFHV